MQSGGFLKALTRLRVNRRAGHFSPHKPVLLLSVLDMALGGKLTQNQVRLDPPLLTRYRDFWNAVGEEGDQPNPYLPFFHMQSEPFWALKAQPGGEAVVAAMRSAGSLGELRAHIDCAALDDEVWQRLQDPAFVEEAAHVLISHWFADKQQAVLAVWEISKYERALSGGAVGRPVADEKAAYVPARDAAFRRLVLEAYDYRCAASGWRFMLDEWFLVEAAHIVPFSESHNDDPRNGIALSPTFHRLMDKNIIAPGPDYLWHVSPVIDRRIPDNRELVTINGLPLILPRNKDRLPEKAYLERRMERLLTP